MSYGSPIYQSITIGEHDFGAGSESLSFQVPSTKKARLIDINLAATETFTATTTAGNIQVGTAADPDAYALLSCATTADTDSICASDSTTALIAQDIPAGTQVEITLTAPTGGTPAGKGFVTITFAIF